MNIVRNNSDIIGILNHNSFPPSLPLGNNQEFNINELYKNLITDGSYEFTVKSISNDSESTVFTINSEEVNIYEILNNNNKLSIQKITSEYPQIIKFDSTINNVNTSNITVTNLDSSKTVIFNIKILENNPLSNIKVLLDGNVIVSNLVPTNGNYTFTRYYEYNSYNVGSQQETYKVIVTDNIGLETFEEVSITIIKDAHPIITGPSGGAGATNSIISINENNTSVHTFSANETIKEWSLPSGTDKDLFEINSSTGALTFKTSPNYEDPKDSDTNNSYVVTVRATDNADLSSEQTVTVTVTDVDDTAPIITGPSGGAGATNSIISINENITSVHTFSANETIKEWSLPSGSDKDLFEINSSTGALTFKTSPDYEDPKDSDTNNSYVVTVRATDNADLSSEQTVTVTVTDVDDTAPIITGPSGGAGATNSIISINENTLTVHTFSANETIKEWTLPSGTDKDLFEINSSTGALTFKTSPDYEDPKDSDTNNLIYSNVVIHVDMTIH